MVSINEMDTITLVPNPVNAGAGLMIRVTFKPIKLTWKRAAAFKWKQLRAYAWGE